MKIIKGNIDVAKEVFQGSEKQELEICSYCDRALSKIWVFYDSESQYMRSRCIDCFDYCAMGVDWTVVTEDKKILAGLLLES